MEMNEEKVKFMKMLSDLQKNNNMEFNDGKISNKEALRKTIKIMRSRGYKELRQEILLTMIKVEAENGNKFGVMYLTQFCVYWDREYKDIHSIDMGQVDLLLRKYYS